MKNKISLKIDTETVPKGKKEDWLIACLLVFGVCLTLYQLVTMDAPEPTATTAKGIAICILIFVFWGVKHMHSKTHLKDRLSKDDTALYELTPKGITNHKGEFQRWDTLKKIYFRGGIVHFSYMTFNRQAPFSMNSESIKVADFYEACEFIKTHAPENATKNFKLENIPRY